MVSWNVNSIRGAFRRDIVLDSLKDLAGPKMDIVSLVETHLKDKIALNGGATF